MKRSEINEILGHTRQFSPCTTCISPLPASHPQNGNSSIRPRQEVFDLKLGWDVTAFGGSSFAAQGLTLFTLRNGSPNGTPYEKCYAEKSCTYATVSSRPCIFTGANGRTSSTAAVEISLLSYGMPVHMQRPKTRTSPSQ